MSITEYSENQLEVIDLYIAAYGRVPAQSGLDFFVNALDSGTMTIEEIRDYMMTNEEASKRYPSDGTLEDYVTTVFENVLGRPPATQEGLAFWTSKFDNPNYTMSDLMLDVLNEAKNNPTDYQTLINREEAAVYFLDTIPQEFQTGNQIYVTDITDSLSLEIVKTEIENNFMNILDTNYSYTNLYLGETSSYNTYGVSALDSTEHWQDQIITYSFNSSIPQDYYTYPDDSLITNWSPLNLEQQDAVRDITEELNQILGITLQEVPNDGMIEFNIVQTDPNVAGFSFYPGDFYSYEGDVFLSENFNLTPDEFSLSTGEFGWMTIAHELGHALGLKHPFEGYYTLPTSLDDTNHTVMSYTNEENTIPLFTLDGSTISVSYDSIYPELYGLYDISTLQAIYGVNDTTNTTDDTYTLNYFDYSLITIWDAGGEDTLDLSDTTGKDIVDMHSGSINSVDVQTFASIVEYNQNQINDSYFDSWIYNKINYLYQNDQLYLGENNLSIANGVIIENLYTGSGDDIVTDNEVDNQIYTNGGNDSIYIGSGGYDFIDGGEGTDTIYLNLTSQDLDITQLDNGSYYIVAEDFALTFTGIEYLHTYDGTISINNNYTLV